MNIPSCSNCTHFRDKNICLECKKERMRYDISMNCDDLVAAIRFLYIEEKKDVSRERILVFALKDLLRKKIEDFKEAKGISDKDYILLGFVSSRLIQEDEESIIKVERD